MGCRIMVGKEAGTDREHACFFDSVTETAFGPLMEGAEIAEDFICWLQRSPDRWARPNHFNGREMTADPRAYTTGRLATLYAEFRKEYDARTAEVEAVLGPMLDARGSTVAEVAERMRPTGASTVNEGLRAAAEAFDGESETAAPLDSRD